MNVPIIGKSRTWKSLKFVVQPVTKTLLLEFPGHQPEIVGWQIGFMGMRSDDSPFQASCILDPHRIQADQDKIGATLGVVSQMFNGLMTFRDCNCLKDQPCTLHKKQALQTMS